MSQPDVTLYEVGPRDGLQNEPESVPTPQKLELVQRLALAGLRRIEAASFVSPKWIPQLADGDDLAALLPAFPGVVYSALVPNRRGYQRFRNAGSLQVAAVFLSASETHNQKNVNCSISEQLERIRPVAECCADDGVRLRAYVSTVCGCPYEGAIATDAVVRLSRDLSELGVTEISLGDTIGVGHPGQIRDLVRAVCSEVAIDQVALHCHDTYGRALANVQAGYEEGIRTFDSALGGLGGCPYAPGASGNVATEDVVDLFETAGITTGIDLDALVDATHWLGQDVLGRTLPGRVYRARQGARERPASAP